METRIVWITLLAMSDRRGIVEGSVPGLAVFARLPLEATRMALERLSGPDEDSRSKEQEGRRIEPVDGGWRLINHAKYRDKMGKDERREYLKLKQREYRQKRQRQHAVDTQGDKSTMLTHTAPAPDTTKRDPGSSLQQATSQVPEISDLSSAHADFETFRTAYPVSRRVGGKIAQNAYKSAAKKTTLAEMMTALAQHLRSEQWQTPKLIPLMTTWLNQERWNQTLPEVRPYGQSPKTAGNVPALQKWAARAR